MKNEHLKKSANRYNLLVRAGCNITLLPIALFLGYMLIGAMYHSLMALQALSPYPIAIAIVLLLVGLVSFVALVYIAVKNLGRLYNHFIVYRKAKDERKRIEHLIVQTQAETLTDADNLEYLIEVENTDKAKYS